jgi:hypothetical protein
MSLVVDKASVHRIARSTFVTIAKRPSRSIAGHVQGTSISDKAKAEYFSWRDWTGGIGLRRLEKLAFMRL